MLQSKSETAEFVNRFFCKATSQHHGTGTLQQLSEQTIEALSAQVQVAMPSLHSSPRSLELSEEASISSAANQDTKQMTSNLAGEDVVGG